MHFNGLSQLYYENATFGISFTIISLLLLMIPDGITVLDYAKAFGILFNCIIVGVHTLVSIARQKRLEKKILLDNKNNNNGNNNNGAGK